MCCMSCEYSFEDGHAIVQQGDRNKLTSEGSSMQGR